MTWGSLREGVAVQVMLKGQKSFSARELSTKVVFLPAVF